MNEDLKRKLRLAVQSYLESERNMRAFTQWLFPQGKPVSVVSERYTGPGVVDHDGICPPTSVPVRVPNGNLWYYSILCVQPVEPVKEEAT